MTINLIAATVDYDSLQKMGANARAVGTPSLRNPYVEERNMPRLSGLSTEEWSRRYAAWEMGWTMEDAMRRTP